ncbi:uncharacterized protein [Dipodomys merriami]|uniref:uncharacterized protein isoform X3 n=1 Tax=Dipodomys merriami TaxID=94247 RepID=UPI003855E8C1
MAYKPPDKEGNKDWWKTGEGKLNLPQRFGNRILKRIHRAFPMGTRRMQDLLQHSEVKIRQGNQLIEDIVKNCKACQLTNAPNQPVTKGARLHGDRPGVYWEVDFTEIKTGKFGYKYLLVFVDTFSGWVEAYPMKHETVNIVAKKILVSYPGMASHPPSGRTMDRSSSQKGLGVCSKAQLEISGTMVEGTLHGATGYTHCP